MLCSGSVMLDVSYLLVAQIFSAKGCLQALSNLFAGDSFEVGGRKNAINDGGVALQLLGSYWQQ